MHQIPNVCLCVCVSAGVQILLQHFQTEEANLLGQGHRGSSSETKLLLTIWALANQESFGQLSDRFDFSRPQSHYIFRQGCTILSRLASCSIIWPSKQEMEMLATNYCRDTLLNRRNERQAQELRCVAVM